MYDRTKQLDYYLVRLSFQERFSAPVSAPPAPVLDPPTSVNNVEEFEAAPDTEPDVKQRFVDMIVKVLDLENGLEYYTDLVEAVTDSVDPDELRESENLQNIAQEIGYPFDEFFDLLIEGAILVDSEEEAEDIKEEAQKTESEEEIIDQFVEFLRKDAPGLAPTIIEEKLYNLGPTILKEHDFVQFIADRSKIDADFVAKYLNKAFKLWRQKYPDDYKKILERFDLEPVDKEEIPKEPAKEEPAKEEPAKEEPAKEEPAKEEPAEEFEEAEEQATEETEEDKETRLQKVDLKDLSGIFDEVMRAVFKQTPPKKLTDPELEDEIETLAAMFDKYYLSERKKKQKAKKVLQNISQWLKTYPKSEHGAKGEQLAKELKQILNDKSHFLKKFKEKGLTQLKIARILHAYLKKQAIHNARKARIQYIAEAYLQKQFA